jgi:hypothetical protein
MKSSPLLLLFLLVVFFSGLYVYATKKIEKYIEPMTHGEELNAIYPPLSKNELMPITCPTLLVKEGNVYVLYNSNEPPSASNPLSFANLEEYTQYAKSQTCPVLFVQKENDVQGNDVYRIRPSPIDLQGGLPYSTSLPHNINEQRKNPLPIMDANRDIPPYNQGNYPGFDPAGLFIGQYTELDKIHDSTQTAPVSVNPMDTNWGGVQYTQQAVNRGDFVENNVAPPLLVNPGKLMQYV